MYVYLENATGSNMFHCRGKVVPPADNPYSFAFKMWNRKDGQPLMVALHEEEMGVDRSSGKLKITPIPLSELKDNVLTSATHKGLIHPAELEARANPPVDPEEE